LAKPNYKFEKRQKELAKKKKKDEKKQRKLIKKDEALGNGEENSTDEDTSDNE